MGDNRWPTMFFSFFLQKEKNVCSNFRRASGRKRARTLRARNRRHRRRRGEQDAELWLELS